MFRLEVLSGDEVVHRQPLSTSPTAVGRGPQNQLVLSHSRVSGRHLRLWCQDGAVWAEDLGSRNGTTLAGAPLTRPTPIPTGTVLLLADAVRLRIAGGAPQDVLPALWVRDLRSGVKLPVRTDRLAIGGEGDGGGAILLVYPGEIWLGEGGQERAITLGEEFQIGARSFVVEAQVGDVSRTEELERVHYPYALRAELGGVAGATASLRDRVRGTQHRVTADIRATLLYVLGTRLQQDRQQELPSSEQGWVTDDEAMQGIWGRKGRAHNPNNLNVLVHRLRKEVASHGFDPWFLEKRRGFLRARLESVDLG